MALRDPGLTQGLRAYPERILFRRLHKGASRMLQGASGWRCGLLQRLSARLARQAEPRENLGTPTPHHWAQPKVAFFVYIYVYNYLYI